MPLSEDNAKLLIGLMAATALIVLIVLSELGHVPLADRTIFLLGGLILGGMGLDIWQGRRRSAARDTPPSAQSRRDRGPDDDDHE